MISSYDEKEKSVQLHHRPLRRITTVRSSKPLLWEYENIVLGKEANNMKSRCSNASSCCRTEWWTVLSCESEVLATIGKKKIRGYSTPTYFMWSLPKGPPPTISSVFASITDYPETSKQWMNDRLKNFALETLNSFISTFSMKIERSARDLFILFQSN